MVTVTQELLNKGMSFNGAWNLAQLNVLGVKDFIKGWKCGLIGTKVTEAQVKEFLRLKNRHLMYKKREFKQVNQLDLFERDCRSHLRAIAKEA